MKLTTLLLPLATLYSTATATEYFFRLTGSTKYPSILNNQRLRTNGSDSPGVTLAPFNPADHFARVAVDNPAERVWTALLVVPTNPHPPPIKGYYGLSKRDNVPDAYRFVFTYRPEDEAPGFEYKDFVLQHVQLSRCTPPKWLLSYRPVTGAPWRWFAVKEKTEAGVEKWALWYIKRGPDNVAIMDTWEYDSVTVDLVEAGPINSNAPGGVDE